MKRLTGMRAAIRLAGSAIALLLLPRASLAEVGVVVNSGAVHGPYLQAIVDDPTPFGGVWARVSNAVSRVVLNPEGAANGDGNPDFSINPVSNFPIVVWSRNNSGNYDVVVSVFSGGAWSTPQIVAGSSDNELDPKIVVDAAGTVHLFYWVDTGTTQRVYYTNAPSDLSSWSAPIAVSGFGEAACRPGAAIHDGVLSVAYEVHPGGFGTTPRQVVVATLEAGSFVAEVVATSNNPSELWPSARCHSGRYWVEWVDTTCANNSPGELGWMRWNPSVLQWEPLRTDPFATTGQRDFSVRPGIRLEAIAP